MTRHVATAAALALVVAGSAAAETAVAPATLPREEVERIVREYLLREPEIIYDAIQELQKRRELAEAERQRQTIVARRDEIFGTADDPVVGNPDGDVTLVEFFDYRCGYCRSMLPGLRELVERDGGVRLVMKEFPILGPDSTLAARAGLAAARQDGSKYMAFHVALMQARELSEPSILALADQIGLDRDRLAADMRSERVASMLDANLDLARALGINGTPSFILGDHLIPGAIDIAQLQRMIDEQRKATN
jgi:protein-disulfide isomerase